MWSEAAELSKLRWTHQKAGEFIEKVDDFLVAAEKGLHE